MQRRAGGGTRHARGVTESEDDLGTGDESEHEINRQTTRSSFNAGGGASGGRGGFTASREPLISVKTPTTTTTDVPVHRGPPYPGMPDPTSSQPQPHPRPTHVKSNSSFSNSGRILNPPPPLSLASPPPQNSHLRVKPDNGPSTPFTPDTTTPTHDRHKKTYAYQLHPSANSFFLRGKLLTGGDSPIPFLISLALVLGLGGLWIGTVGVNMWRDGVGGAGGGGGIAVVIIFCWIWGVALGGMFGTVSHLRHSAEPVTVRQLMRSPPTGPTSLLM